MSEETTAGASIEALRREIDAADAELIELLSRRARL